MLRSDEIARSTRRIASGVTLADVERAAAAIAVKLNFRAGSAGENALLSVIIDGAQYEALRQQNNTLKMQLVEQQIALDAQAATISHARAIIREHMDYVDDLAIRNIISQADVQRLAMLRNWHIATHTTCDDADTEPITG